MSRLILAVILLAAWPVHAELQRIGPNMIIVDGPEDVPEEEREHTLRRMNAVMKDYPEDHKAKLKYHTFGGGHKPFRYIEVLTPLNAKGEPDGVQIYWPNWYKPPIRKVPYKEGKEHGVEKHWVGDKEQVLIREIPWVEGKIHGEKKQYHDNGQLANITVYEDGQAQGEARSYDKEGNLVRIAHYKDGELEGESVDYWPGTEQKKRVIVRKNGKVHGVCKEWYQSGDLKWERPFKDNKLHGVETHYTPEGEVEKQRSWLEGKPVSQAEYKAAR